METLKGRERFSVTAETTLVDSGAVQRIAAQLHGTFIGLQLHVRSLPVYS